MFKRPQAYSLYPYEIPPGWISLCLYSFARLVVVPALLISPVLPQECPPDTQLVTPIQNEWMLPYVNSWDGLEIMTWNVEQYPKQDIATRDAVNEIMADLLPDIIAFQEITSYQDFVALMNTMPMYDWEISTAGTPLVATAVRSEAATIISAEQWFVDHDSLWYSFAGRPPLKLEVNWHCGSLNITFALVNVHLKCCDDGLERRRAAARLMRQTILNSTASGDDLNWVVVGDWNDDLTDPPAEQSFTVFLEDTLNFYFVNLPIAGDPEQASYPTWPSFLDNILITSPLFDLNIAAGVETLRLDDYVGGWEVYEALISDHRPVLWSVPIAQNYLPMLVINEIMQNPAAVTDQTGEWFEIFNNDSVPVDLNNWKIRDDDNEVHQINSPEGTPILAGEYLVLGINGDINTNGGIAVDYAYEDFFLANGNDEVVLQHPSGVEVDRVVYDGGPQFPDPTGASMALLHPDLDNSAGSSWGISTTPLPGGDYGTPGAQNEGVIVGTQVLLSRSPSNLRVYPNPSNGQIRINFGPVHRGGSQIEIRDLQGRFVRKFHPVAGTPGAYSLLWDGTDSNGIPMPSGIYIVRFAAGGRSESVKALLLK